MNKLALSLIIIFIATPSEAHCFTRWHYPWPQRCWLASHQHHTNAAPNQEQVRNEAVRSRNEAVWPDLEALDWGYADYYGVQVDRLRGIALLRALSDVRADQ